MVEEIGVHMPLWLTIPFAGILLSIAVLPLVAPHFWHKHFGKVSAFWALACGIPFVLLYKGAAVHSILHTILVEYIPFLVLLGALYTIAGGIYIKGSFVGRPVFNSVLLFIGAMLASLMGTTGAAMLLIRPLIRANRWRQYKTFTVVFFIFLVANIGGALTPLGDPPLFLGFLKGVPFFFTLKLIPIWATAVAIVLGIFFAVDSYFYAKEDKTKIPNPDEKFEILGKINFLFLFGVLAAVLLSGIVHLPQINVLGVHLYLQDVLRDIALVVLGVLSLLLTPPVVREKNEFTWFPIKEVAILFIGIFIAMIPCLKILEAGEHGPAGSLIHILSEPYHYFWTTGVLSSFLDNAPTYLTFLMTALGKFYPGVPVKEAVHKLIETHSLYLEAISAGAVFFGAVTYIGNAPNFMVASIAREQGVEMPSFFGYIIKYSIPVLITTFVVLTFLFFM
ncbi:sodium:proton antiporter [Desulfurobacterium atlanticum]|uniref:Transporter, UIT6 family n=1 Tax=Desulfurobacterium atlanticum TaxID=240169 RepID=A0A239A7V0_9BACT|nr:sodium:proton antiporter [Desulfurobacterium atlanticum]SNR91715.1 transporter, UIT6 family [Desulfurobacterium atlanticum]